jgi:hypothetical protein
MKLTTALAALLLAWATVGYAGDYRPPTGHTSITDPYSIEACERTVIETVANEGIERERALEIIEEAFIKYEKGEPDNDR